MWVKLITKRRVNMQLGKCVGALAVGGISFWTPTVTIELITQREVSPVIGTALPLGTVLLAYALVGRAGRSLHSRWASIWMLGGVYVLGPSMMYIGWTYLGGARDLDLPRLVLGSSIPLYTLYMAGPDVTLFGVLLATVALILIHMNFERKRQTNPSWNSD
jgi:hypothetical protein